MREIIFETKGWPKIGQRVLTPLGKMGTIKSYLYYRCEIEYESGDFTEYQIQDGWNTVALKPNLLIKLDE